MVAPVARLSHALFQSRADQIEQCGLAQFQRLGDLLGGDRFAEDDSDGREVRQLVMPTERAIGSGNPNGTDRNVGSAKHREEARFDLSQLTVGTARPFGEDANPEARSQASDHFSQDGGSGGLTIDRQDVGVPQHPADGTS